jgi:hypothetical protein
VRSGRSSSFSPPSSCRPPRTGPIDAAFLIFFGAACLIVVQALSLALAIFQDTRVEPVFPRWVAYFSVWMASILALGSLDVFFKDGPFAWDGLVTFWLDFAAFGAWAVVVTVQLIRSIGVHEKDGSILPL